MRTLKPADSERDSVRNYPDLTHKYGEIGISAVAAAVRYQQEDVRASSQHRAYSDHED